MLYKKIFNYLLYKNKQHIIGKYSSIELTPSINNTIEREVAAALESVLPRAGLRPFISLNTTDKVAQLCELSNIVIGIRLFNKEIGKGGVGLESFNQILQYPARSLFQILNKEVTHIIEACDNYTIFFNVLPQFIQASRPSGAGGVGEEEFSALGVVGVDPTGEFMSEKMLVFYKDELTYKRQYLIYVLELKSDVQISEQKIAGLEGKYQKKLAELQELIGNKTSIPKDQVYPRFDSLSQIYSELLEEKVVGQVRMELFNVLLDYKEKLTVTLPGAFIKQAKLIYLEKANKMREIETKIAENTDSSVLKNEIIRLMPNTTPDFMHIPLDFLGFCLWTIVKKNGLLLPGKPNLGVFKYNERYCVFSDENAIEEFVADPEYFMKSVLEICRKCPELIHLLKLQDEFPDISLATLLQGREGAQPIFSISAPLMVDKEIETPVHFEEKKTVADYHWNEWDLRKKALQMANIRAKKTISTQTVLSNFRRDNESQVYLPKDQETNTMVNEGTSTELAKKYTVGLRDKNVK
jgi:hypothetical protein